MGLRERGLSAPLRPSPRDRSGAAPRDERVSPTYVPDLVNVSLDLLIDGAERHLASGERRRRQLVGAGAQVAAALGRPDIVEECRSRARNRGRASRLQRPRYRTRPEAAHAGRCAARFVPSVTALPNPARFTRSDRSGSPYRARHGRLSSRGTASRGRSPSQSAITQG